MRSNLAVIKFPFVCCIKPFVHCSNWIGLGWTRLAYERDGTGRTASGLPPAKRASILALARVELLVGLLVQTSSLQAKPRNEGWQEDAVAGSWYW